MSVDAAILLTKTSVVQILSDNFKAILVNDAPTVVTDVKAVPITADVGYGLVTLGIAGIEAVATWRIAANAPPCIWVKSFSGYVLHT